MNVLRRPERKRLGVGDTSVLLSYLTRQLVEHVLNIGNLLVKGFRLTNSLSAALLAATKSFGEIDCP